MIHEPFMISILRLLPYDAAHRHVVADFCGQRGLYIADNRNALCRQFLKSNSEWMWMLDTDITFEPQVLYQLLDSADPMKRPIVSAVYFSYVNSNEVLSPVWLERTANHDFRTIKDFDGGMQKLDAIGMGCVVIHRSVIEKFKAQYSEPFIWFGHDVLEHADGSRMAAGEDVTFCVRAQTLGIQIWGNGGVTVGHIKAHEETIRSFVKKYEAFDIAQGQLIADDSQPKGNGTAPVMD